MSTALVARLAAAFETDWKPPLRPLSVAVTAPRARHHGYSARGDHGRARADRQRQRPTSRTSGAGPARDTRSVICGPAPAGPRLTARRSASSVRCSGSGPTATPTPRARTAPARSRATCGGTTDADPTARSAAFRPSDVSHMSVGSTASSSAAIQPQCELPVLPENVILALS